MASTIKLSSDQSFHFELIRTIGHTRYYGADINEVLQAAGEIEAGSFDSFYNVFYALATRVRAQADAINAAKNPVSAREAYFRAATYFRTACLYLNGKPDDPRINSVWEEQLVCFDKAIALLPQPGKRASIKGDGFDIPTIFFPAAPTDGKPRPTILVSIGYDSGQDEVFHAFGFAALDRGYNVMTYEGPGQGSLRRRQGVGFTHEWERAVSPVVDHLMAHPDVDSTRIALVGWSLGRYLSVRAAAFKARIAAVLAIDGVWNFFTALYNLQAPAIRDAYDAGDMNKVNKLIREALAGGHLPSTARWGLEHGQWSFAVDSPAEFLKKTELMTLDGVIDRVKCPVFVAEVAAALGSKAHLCSPDG